MTTHARASAGKGCIMKLVRTRIAVAIASSAMLASGFALTAFSAVSASPGAPMLTASQVAISVCPNGTIYDYCTRK